MDHEIVKEFVCHQKGHLEVPSLCPPPLTNQLIQCWEYNPNDRPKFETLFKVIEELLAFKEEFQARVCYQYNPSWSPNIHSRKTSNFSTASNFSRSTSNSTTYTTITSHNPTYSIDYTELFSQDSNPINHLSVPISQYA